MDVKWKVSTYHQFTNIFAPFLLSTYPFHILQICLPIMASVRTAGSWSRVLGAMFVILTDAFRSILSSSDKNTLFIGTMCNLADLCFCKIIPQTLSVSDHRVRLALNLLLPPKLPSLTCLTTTPVFPRGPGIIEWKAMFLQGWTSWPGLALLPFRAAFLGWWGQVGTHLAAFLIKYPPSWLLRTQNRAAETLTQREHC